MDLSSLFEPNTVKAELRTILGIPVTLAISPSVNDEISCWFTSGQDRLVVTFTNSIWGTNYRIDDATGEFGSDLVERVLERALRRARDGRSD